MVKKTSKAMPKCATETKQGAKIAKEEISLAVKGKKKTVKVYAITVAGQKQYALRRPLAPVNNAKYQPMEKLAMGKGAAKTRRGKKSVPAVELSENAKALIPVLAKLGKSEIKVLAVESLKYKRTNAKLIKAQIKGDKLKAKRDALQKQIDALEGAGK